MIQILVDKSQRMESDEKWVKHIPVDPNKKESNEPYKHIIDMMQNEPFKDHNMVVIEF